MNSSPSTHSSITWEMFQRTRFLPSEPAEGLHRLLRLASGLVRVPIAFISVVEGDRPVVRSQIGLSEALPRRGETSPSLAICRHLVASGEPLLIHASNDHEQGDALDELTGAKPSAFVGFPLRSADGVVLGTFGILDLRPRVWHSGEVGLLSELSALAVTELNTLLDAQERQRIEENHSVLCSQLVEAQKARTVLEAQLPRVQRMASLGTLACGVAHEFNNLLSAIIGNATRARVHARHGEVALEPIDEILQASQRAREVVRQVLGYGRKQNAQRQTLDLGPVLQECVKLLRSTLPCSVDLILKCNPETPPVLADPTQITQAVINLVTNAWHALDHHSGRIEVALEPSTPTTLEPRLPGTRSASHACIAVTDNGKGMAPSTAERIFEPFFTTKGPEEGTGLGLSIVQSILQDHGGQARVNSQLGRGTTVTLLFPAAPEQMTAATPLPRPAPRGNGERIWLLDDDQTQLALMSHQITRLGYEVSAFWNHAEAVSSFAAQPEMFALAISDCNLPGVTGLEIAGRLRSAKHDIPIILSSGCITDSLRVEATRAGIADLFPKHNSMEDLGATVHTILSSRPKT